MRLSPAESWQRELPDDVFRLMGRIAFGTACALALITAALFIVTPEELASAPRAALVSAFVAYGAASGWAFGRCTRERFRIEVAFFWFGFGAMALVVITSLTLRYGIRNPAVGYIGLIVCLVCAINSLRLGVTLAAIGAVEVAGLAWAEVIGLVPPPAVPAPLALSVVLHWLVIVTGVAIGTLISGVLSHYLRTSAERERRFAGLLGIAVDCYWEMDARYTVTHLSRRDSANRFEAMPQPLRPPWQQAGVLYDAGKQETHQADLLARRPFHDLYVRSPKGDGSLRHELVSGEPRYDGRGDFLGYWGVSRDITVDVEARRALAATETRYRELFARTPSPLVLHRQGRILDANAAAGALLGVADAHELIGLDLLALYDPADRERLLRRVRQIEQMPIGEGLSPTEFRLVSRTGQHLIVQASGVRVETAAGPATLSIYLDQTEQRKTQAEAQRSQALLSHLVATSPDAITLTELDTGRYAMVNQTFTRLVGYTADEVVGRSAVELGIWHDAADRQRLVEALRNDGKVEDLPVRFVAKSGAVVALRVSGARFEMDGRAYLVINARDVSAAEQGRLQREAILENAQIGIAFTRDRAFMQVNPAMEQMFGWPVGTLLGQPGSAVWSDAAEYAAIGARLGPALARGEPVELVHEMSRRDGTRFWCRILAKAVDPNRPTSAGTIWIIDDITEQRAFEQALAKARDDAQAANSAKSAFLANTSHELRTPLSGLIGLARLARQPGVDEARRQQYLDQISDSAQTLSAIISDILDLSKIEAGKLQIEQRPFDLHDLLHGLQRGYAMLASERSLTMSLDVDAGVPSRVVGDALRLRQVLVNFLSNALKFTPRGEVGIQVRALDAGGVRFEVHDTGPGIDEATQARLFRPFTQADQSTTRRFGGTGLGLSICQELAELMGGAVGVVSTLGIGSCFWLELPLVESEDDAPVSGLGGLDEPPMHGARILLVEDNPVNMMIGVAMLEQWGLQVEQAGNGQQAVLAVGRAAREGRPFDAVLMDVQMPVMSGHEAARRLRQEHSAQQLPIIALTAAALTTERDEALAAGMNDFLTKPIDPPRLQSVLAHWVHRGSAIDPAHP